MTTTTNTGLHLVAPELATRVARITPDERRILLQRACSRAIEHAQVENDTVRAGLAQLLSNKPADEEIVSTLRSISNELEDRYFELWDDEDGEVTRSEKATEQALAYFSKARAVSALAFALSGSVDVVAAQHALSEAIAAVAGHSGPTSSQMDYLIGNASIN
jgi:hypothetical protein